eukprot:855415-Rhodomonas_salina.1
MSGTALGRAADVGCGCGVPLCGVRWQPLSRRTLCCAAARLGMSGAALKSKASQLQPAAHGPCSRSCRALSFIAA